MNPLEGTDAFPLTFANPNPSSSKTRNGPVYRVSFELTQEEWQYFMDTDTAGMVIDAMCMTGGVSPDITDTVPIPPLTQTYGDEAAKLKLSGFCERRDVWKALGFGLTPCGEGEGYDGPVSQNCWDTIKATLGYDSMRDVPPKELRRWAEKNQVQHFLPECYKTA